MCGVCGVQESDVLLSLWIVTDRISSSEGSYIFVGVCLFTGKGRVHPGCTPPPPTAAWMHPLMEHGCLQDATPLPRYSMDAPLDAPPCMHPLPPTAAWMHYLETPPPCCSMDRRSTGGRYASYWNAFLFTFFSGVTEALGIVLSFTLSETTLP